MLVKLFLASLPRPMAFGGPPPPVPSTPVPPTAPPSMTVRHRGNRLRMSTILGRCYAAGPPGREKGPRSFFLLHDVPSSPSHETCMALVQPVQKFRTAPCLSKPEEHRTPPYGTHACANSSTKPTVSSSRARMLSGQAERLLVPAPLSRRGDRAFSRRTMAGPTHPHASGSRNGHLHGVAEPTPLATAAELNSLRREVEELRQLLWAHQQGAHACPTPNTTRQIESGMPDRREEGMFDSRFHSTSSGATPRDFRTLPIRIVLIRHAESEGNVDNIAYTYLPDSRVPLTTYGWQQALTAGERVREVSSGDAHPPRLFFYTSPYLRSKQTFEGVAAAFDPGQIMGAQEEVQLREQDFGNFQDAEGKQREKAERLRFGRFFYRFPNGESGADVYDRMTIFEDHLVRDINAGRFGPDATLVLVTHGLALRIFLMRWFHWTVEEFMGVFNPPNAEPLVLERVVHGGEATPGGPAAWIHTKALYRLTPQSRMVIKGCSDVMCSISMDAQSRELDPLENSFYAPSTAASEPTTTAV
uniref:Broad-range acid phosphatase DET1 n=1 Tax=Auxenochlorella protothecoides TaxID=3075 RepID=A0A1D2AFU0_AUXPR